MRIQKVIIAAVLCAAFTSVADELEMTKELLSKWVEARKLISEERQQWELEREVLSDRLDLVRSETDSLNEKIHETRAEITSADQKRAKLVEENDGLKEASATLVNRIFSTERSVLRLLTQLPEPVQERMKPLSQRIPSSSVTDLSLSERYQNVVGILNELNKAANEITVVSEVRALPGGNRAEVQTLYIGFARAYYASLKGDIGGYGTPSDAGEWVWTSDASLAEKVNDAIAILKNEKVATYIPLPVRVY
jgi:transposase-like protein